MATGLKPDALGSPGHGEMWFHTDKCYVERPHRASLLYSMELPAEGGHTKFASLYRAYDALPQDLGDRLDGRRVLQVYDFTRDQVADVSEKLDELLHFWQPIFVTNPDSGKKAVYVCHPTTSPAACAAAQSRAKRCIRGRRRVHDPSRPK